LPGEHRLLELLSQPWRWGTKSVPVRLSMGIVHAEQAGTDAEVLLADACTAMVEAQRAGGGRWMVFDAAMHQRANQAHALRGRSCGRLSTMSSCTSSTSRWWRLAIGA
jgi:predicted signal transduction protein with EAL and GGDEF domain